MSDEKPKAREWWLPIATLIVNSDIRRPNGTHVIEYAVLEAAQAEIAEMHFELEAKQRPLGEQVLELTLENQVLQAKLELYESQMTEAREEITEKKRWLWERDERCGELLLERNDFQAKLEIAREALEEMAGIRLKPGIGEELIYRANEALDKIGEKA